MLPLRSRVCGESASLNVLDKAVCQAKSRQRENQIDFHTKVEHWFGDITPMKTQTTLDGVARIFWHYFCRIFGITTLVGSPIPLLLLALLYVQGTATSAHTTELLMAFGLSLLAAFGFLQNFPAWYPRKLAEPAA